MSDSIDWCAVRQLLEDDTQCPAIDASFPQKDQLSFKRALDEVSAQVVPEIWTAGRTLEKAIQLKECPIIAVAGMLNSGKTSLVATFLSDSGRARTLRGESNEEGTHRFVLWLPQQWQSDPELWAVLLSRLSDTLGRPAELLSEDPEQAHAQYNNLDCQEDALAVPLVATDPRLDELAVGLLDCPDIVTSEIYGRGTISIRQELLRQAAKLCSTFLIVTDYASIRARTVGEILEIVTSSMPEVPRYLAVNKVRPRYEPQQVIADLEPLIKAHSIEQCYLAYDFEIRGSEEMIPDCAPEAGAAETVPVFSDYASQPDDIKSLPPEALLTSLPMRLSRSELFHGFRQSQESLLRRRVWDDAVESLRGHLKSESDRIIRTRQTVCDVSMDFFARHDAETGVVDELRLHQSSHIITQLQEAFAATAPWYARLGMKMNGLMARFTQSASDLAKRYQLTAAAQEKAVEIRDQFRRGSQGSVITPEYLSNAYQRHDLPGQMRVEIDQGELLQFCETAVRRFHDEDRTTLDNTQLEEIAAQMWHELSFAKKLQHGLTPVAALFASFAAVLMVPIDAGGSFLLQASIAELLLATGLTGLVTAWNNHGSVKTMEMQAAKQQLSDFISIQCDVLGIPNAPESALQPLHCYIGNQSYELPAPKVSIRPLERKYQSLARSSNNSANPSDPSHERGFVIWELRDSFVDALHNVLPRVGD